MRDHNMSKNIQIPLLFYHWTI